MRDEGFHGSNPTEGVALTGEVMCVDTLMHSGHRAHGGAIAAREDTATDTANITTRHWRNESDIRSWRNSLPMMLRWAAAGIVVPL